MSGFVDTFFNDLKYDDSCWITCWNALQMLVVLGLAKRIVNTANSFKRALICQFPIDEFTELCRICNRNLQPVLLNYSCDPLSKRWPSKRNSNSIEITFKPRSKINPACLFYTQHTTSKYKLFRRSQLTSLHFRIDLLFGVCSVDTPHIQFNATASKHTPLKNVNLSIFFQIQSKPNRFHRKMF